MKDIKIFKQTSIFNSLDESEIIKGLNILNSEEISLKKSDLLIAYGDVIDKAAIIKSGSMDVKMLNFTGSEFGINRFFESDMFLTAYVIANCKHSPIEVKASENCVLEIIDIKRLFDPQLKEKELANRLLSNLIMEISQKNVFQNLKIEILIQKKIRQKLAIFFHSMGANKKDFELKLNRQALADFLGVDRSALSRELAVLKDEGLIVYDRNKITIVDDSFIYGK